MCSCTHAELVSFQGLSGPLLLLTSNHNKGAGSEKDRDSKPNASGTRELLPFHYVIVSHSYPSSVQDTSLRLSAQLCILKYSFNVDLLRSGRFASLTFLGPNQAFSSSDSSLLSRKREYNAGKACCLSHSLATWTFDA